MKIIKYCPSYYNKVKDLLSVEDINPKTNKSYNMELFEEHTTGFYTSFLVIENDELLGVITISLRLERVEINHLFVESNQRGKGIGSRLIKAVEKYSKKDLKAECIILNVTENNFLARKFYEKEGYKETGKVYNYFLNNKNQIFYFKLLF